MQQYEEVAAYLLQNTQYRPEIGIICGSGLSGLSKALQNPQTFDYSKIPNFPKATVPGHTGELVFGTIGDKNLQCVCMRGRFHFYEGNSMEKVVLPVRVLRLLGVKLLIVTNAAGGLNPTYNVGDIMVIQDHFGMPVISGNHPLRGENDDSLGPRFPAVSDAYDDRLQSLLVPVASDLGLSHILRLNGTYCFVSGPAYESRAESRFLRNQVGGDSVGMSTVPEVLAAKHCGMKVLGLSLITNKVLIDKTANEVHASHAEVLEAVEASGRHVEALIRGLVNLDDLRAFLSSLPTPNFDPSKKLKAHRHPGEPGTDNATCPLTHPFGASRGTLTMLLSSSLLLSLSLLLTKR